MKKKILVFLLSLSSVFSLSSTALATDVDAETELNSSSKTAEELSAKNWKSLATSPRAMSPLSTFEKLISDSDLENLAQSTIHLLSWIQNNPSPVSTEPKPYKRDEHFGSWIHPEHGNCQNTRALILIRDSSVKVKFKDSNECSVVSGKWYDHYTNQTFTMAEDIQIDHFIPLKHAYLAGAFKWNKKRRCHYGNFMATKMQLRSSSGEANMEKGDSSPDEWMPDSRRYACQYITDWLKVKAIWELSFADEELTAIRSYLKQYQCDSNKLKMDVAELRALRKASATPIEACQ